MKTAHRFSFFPPHLRRGALPSLLVLAAGAFWACSKEDASNAGDGDGDGDMMSAGGMGGDVPIVDTSLHSYGADDERLQYMGRWDFSDPEAPVTTLPAAQVTFRFAGDSVTALVDDQFRYGKYRNFFDVVVDGEIISKVALERDEDSIVLVEELDPGVHTLSLIRRTEPQIGEWTFRGLSIGGTLLDPPDAPDRKILFIGDSITAGSGAEATNGSPRCSEGAFGEDGEWGIPYHNAHLAYGPVAARSLDAAYHVLGVSGIGLIRNYTSQYDTRPMPEVYDLLYLEKDPLAGQSGEGGMGGLPMIDPGHLWDPELFVPDAVVVALGTNDFSLGDSSLDDPRPDLTVEEFAAAYVDFVDKLRAHYPSATFFGMTSPMLGDGWPRSEDTFLSDHREAIAAVDLHYDDAGFDDFHPIVVDKVPGTGCGTHPSVSQHADLADDVATVIADAMDW